MPGPSRLPFEVTTLTPLSGGDLNAAFRAELGDGSVIFVKTSIDSAGAKASSTDCPGAEVPTAGIFHPEVPPTAFRAEAAALEWIRAVPDAPPVPEVLAVGDDFLALEWLDPGPRDDVVFGVGLAALHRAGAEAFGSRPPEAAGCLRLGPLTLALAPDEDWATLYGDQVLAPLIRRAPERGALTAAAAGAVERVCERLARLVGPAEPPARLHGDLWAGNAMGGYLIDPASYGGHREVDLAMMSLFGGFSERCLSAYDEVFALADGWRERMGLWQLAPLLVHAVLFGGGYGARVETAAGLYL